MIIPTFFGRPSPLLFAVAVASAASSLAAANPTVTTDDFSEASYWPLALATANGTVVCTDNRLNFVCPASPEEGSVAVRWGVTTLPVDHDWSIRCQAHIDAVSLGGGAERWLTESFAVAATGATEDSRIGIAFCRDSSEGGYSVSEDSRFNGTALTNSFHLGTPSDEVGLRIDYQAYFRTFRIYVDTDGSAGPAGWMWVGGSGVLWVQPASYTVYLRAAAQDVAVTTGAAYFHDFEAVVNPAYALADYHMPAVAGATWLYSGRDWTGNAAYTRLQIADPAFALDLYSGTTDPTPYTLHAVKLAYSDGDLVGGVYQPRSNTDWYEYRTTNRGFALLGWDTPPDESGRLPGMLFPSQLARGQRIELSVPYYFFGTLSGVYYCALELLDNEIVTVPAGTFSDCIHLRFYSSTVGFADPDAQVFDEWWARGVGIVRYQGVSGYGAQQLRELESCSRPDLSPVVRNVAAAGEVYSVTFAHAGSWVVERKVDWVHISDMSGTGDATLSVSVSSNQGPARQAAINIGGLVHWISQAATPAPLIVTQVADRDGRIGADAVFSTTASGAPDLRYQWQRLAAGGGAFEDLVEGSTYVGVSSPMLTVHSLDLSMTGNRFQCVVHNDYGSVQTWSGELTVHEEFYTSFADWAAGVFTPAGLSDPAVAGPNADPSGAGVSNLIRYAFDLPAPGVSLTGPIAPVSLEAGENDSTLTVMLHRKSYAPDIRYIVEGSFDLRNWATVSTFTAGYPRDILVRDYVGTSNMARRFLRVRIDLVP